MKASLPLITTLLQTILFQPILQTAILLSTFRENLSKCPSKAITTFTDGSKTTDKLRGAFYVLSIMT